MTTGKPVIYWDSCVFLAWAKNETRPNNEMDGVEHVAQLIHKNNVVLLTSALTDTEILDSTLDHDAKQKLRDLFKRKNCQKVDVDSRITTLAQQIRDFYQQRKSIDNLPTVTTPDALHLATAIHYVAEEFHTFDEYDQPRKRRALIPLNGNVAGFGLTICKPPIPPRKPETMSLFGEGNGN